MGEPVAERRGKAETEPDGSHLQRIHGQGNLPADQGGILWIAERTGFGEGCVKDGQRPKEARHPPALERKRSQGLLTHHHCVSATVPSCGISDLAIR